MVLFWSHNSFIHLVFSPLIEIKDELCREIHRVCPFGYEVQVVLSTVKDKSVTYAHAVNQCLPHSLDSLISSELSHGYRELQLM